MCWWEAAAALRRNATLGEGPRVFAMRSGTECTEHVCVCNTVTLLTFT